MFSSMPTCPAASLMTVPGGTSAFLPCGLKVTTQLVKYRLSEGPPYVVATRCGEVDAHLLSISPLSRHVKLPPALRRAPLANGQQIAPQPHRPFKSPGLRGPVVPGCAVHARRGEGRRSERCAVHKSQKEESPNNRALLPHETSHTGRGSSVVPQRSTPQPPRPLSGAFSPCVRPLARISA
jgi:hypothetical protein